MTRAAKSSCSALVIKLEDVKVRPVLELNLLPICAKSKARITAKSLKALNASRGSYRTCIFVCSFWILPGVQWQRKLAPAFPECTVRFLNPSTKAPDILMCVTACDQYSRLLQKWTEDHLSQSHDFCQHAQSLPCTFRRPLSIKFTSPRFAAGSKREFTTGA